MAKVPNGIKTLPKISIAWVGCTNVTDDRQTDDRQTDGRRHIANLNLSSRSLKTDTLHLHRRCLITMTTTIISMMRVKADVVAIMTATWRSLSRWIILSSSDVTFFNTASSSSTFASWSRRHITTPNATGIVEWTAQFAAETEMKLCSLRYAGMQPSSLCRCFCLWCFYHVTKLAWFEEGFNIK